MFSDDSETDFGLKQNGWVMGLQGVMGEIVGNLLEKYWSLDSFGADLVLRMGGRVWWDARIKIKNIL